METNRGGKRGCGTEEGGAVDGGERGKCTTTLMQASRFLATLADPLVGLLKSALQKQRGAYT